VNYRHIYHAGNFADVLKHTVLALVIEYLKLKPAPFRVIDTHAGIGLYDLTSERAQKTGEWRDGIGRVLDAAPGFSAGISAALAPYLSVVRSLNPDGQIRYYPGSPLVARRLMRSGDPLIANELHPEDFAELGRLLAREPNSKALQLDGYVALRSMLPPKERRGVVLMDPPFEVADELGRLKSAVGDFVRRFSTGILMIWYPIKDPGLIDAFLREIEATGLSKLLIAELYIRAPQRRDVLNGCGLLILNPPYTLADQLEALLPVLAEVMAQGPGAHHRLQKPAISPGR